MEQTNPNLLQDFEQEVYLEPVSAGIRFVNYLIDIILFYVFVFAFGALLGIALYSQNADVNVDVDAGSSVAVQYLLGIVLIVAYYTLFEGISKGRTVGKMLTGCIVVKDDGSPITFKDAFLRSLCRLIPFEPFSAFGGRPWHDSITKTMVVKKTK